MKTSKFPLIFIVEDNSVYSKLIVSHLRSHKFINCESFTSGEACLKGITREPDIIILDYLINELMTNEELQKNFKVENYFESFKIFTSLYEQYNPYKKFKGLLSFMENKFFVNIFDSDLTTLLNVLNFFTKNYECLVELDGIENLERIKRLLVMNLDIAETIAKEDEKFLIENIKVVLKSYAWI